MHIGYDNHVPYWKVSAILVPRGSAMKRLREEATLAGRLLDATGGRKTRGMVITDTNQVILSAVAPETLRGRLEKRSEGLRTTGETPVPLDACPTMLLGEGA